jgi:2-hydroxy-6-oxonona-2,4-dienedioate hydrolase
MSLVQTALQQAQRIEMSMPWGSAVWHVWRPARVLAAKPLVLLHGGSGSWTHWVNNVLDLSQDRDVWALDIPGFGDSALPSHVKDADDLVPYLAQILSETFHQIAVDMVGFSFGGMTAGLMAAQYPNLVSTLVLIGVPGLGLMVENLPMRGMLDSMTHKQRRAVHRHNLNAMMLANPEHVTEDLIDLQMTNVDRDRMRRRRIARTDVLAKVQTQWRCPVHGIWGAQDALYVNTLPRVPEVLHTLSTFQVIPDAGHWVQFENSKAFHAALEKTL